MPGLRTRVTPLAVALALLAASSGADDTQTEVWPEGQAFFKLGARVRLHLLADVWYAPASWTPDGTVSNSEAETGVHLDLTLKPMLRPRVRTRNWERERYLWARVGYDYLWAPGDPAQPSHENRGIVEVTGRAHLGGEVFAVGRARVDFRDKNGTYSNRYRGRLMLERETPLFGLETVPYVSAELLYDTRYDAWSEERYQVGLEMVLDPHWRLEPYYLRKQDTQSEPRHTNAFGLVLRYYH